MQSHTSEVPPRRYPHAPMGLLRRMADDDRFRAEVERDPVAALARHGVQLDPRHLPEQVALPTREALQSFLEETSDSDGTAKPYSFMGFFGGLVH